MSVLLPTLQDTQRRAESLGSLLQAGDVIGLSGPLGAGKTVFVGGLAEGLGTDPSFRVTSPTFVYAHVYPGRIPLHHLDLYRIENARHLQQTGIEELIGGEAVAAIEWIDRFPEVWDGDRLEVQLTPAETGGRELSARAFGDRFHRILDRWMEAA